MKSFTLITLFALLAVTQAMPAADVEKRAAKYAINVKSATYFCSFMPPKAGDNVGDTEQDGIPMCTTFNLGGTIFPPGFIKTAHFASTSSYAQVTGTIDRTKYKLSASDGGGQYDNKDVSATCNGYKYFVNLIEPDAQVFCIRCCASQSDCNLGISTRGCEKIVPGNYS